MHKSAIWNEQAANPGGTGLADDDRPEDREKIASIRARQRAIGRELRRMYDEVVQEQIPDDFLDLLRQIDAKEENKGKKPE